VTSAVALPVSDAETVDSSGSSLSTAIVAALDPLAVGANSMVTFRDSPGASVNGESSTRPKWAASPPLRETLVTESVEAPSLLTVTFARAESPTETFPKSYADVESAMSGSSPEVRSTTVSSAGPVTWKLVTFASRSLEDGGTTPTCVVPTTSRPGRVAPSSTSRPWASVASRNRSSNAASPWANVTSAFSTGVPVSDRTTVTFNGWAAGSVLVSVALSSTDPSVYRSGDPSNTPRSPDPSTWP